MCGEQNLEESPLIWLAWRIILSSRYQGGSDDVIQHVHVCGKCLCFLSTVLLMVIDCIFKLSAGMVLFTTGIRVQDKHKLR